MRIGYLASGIFSSYNRLVWKGIHDLCREKNSAFLYFEGGELGSPDMTHSQRNFIFDLPRRGTVDGILVNSATIFHALGREDIVAFYRKFASMPIVSVGIKVGDWPAATTDNRLGMREAVIHMVEKHGYRKIAFITGPERNPESETRLSAFKRTLEEYGVPFRPELVAKGNFSPGSGEAGLSELLAKGVSFDAVMAANDEMAIGAMTRAQALGISIPDELALCGYDDIDEASNATIPLSTVRQPISEEARAACGLLFGLVEGGGPVDDVVLSTHFVRRRSCGCLSREVERAEAACLLAAESGAGSGGVGELSRRKEEILASLDGAGLAPKTLASARVFLDSLARYVSNDRADAAVREIEKILVKAAIDGPGEFDRWEDLVSELVGRTRACLLSPLSDLARADAFWHQVRVIMRECAHQSHFLESWKDRTTSARLQDASWKLIRCFDVPKLVETMRDELPKVGVVSCHLCLYGIDGNGRRECRLMLAFDGNGSKALPPDGLPFSADDFLPPGFLAVEDGQDYFIEALFLEAERLGYVVFRADPSEVRLEELRRQISSAVKGAALNDEVRALASAEKNRAAELGEAYAELKRNQQKMLAIEKMASIGKLTAGLAHEMNTPIATIRASSMELDSLIREYGQSIGDADVSDADHRAIAAEMASQNGIIRKAAERTASFVQSVKSQTRDLSKLDYRDFDAVPVIDEAILLLNHQIRKSACTVSFAHPEESVLVNGIDGRLSQVVTNLLTNAIYASSAKGGGPISIRLEREGQGIVLRVSDEGTGIEEAVIPKIFDPMFTTKPMGEGTGLGLTIVRDIVTEEFGGAVEVKSEPGVGTVFTISIPDKRARGQHA